MAQKRKDEELQKLREEMALIQADIRSYTILDAEQVGEHLVLKVQYMHPDGRAQKNCTFEGVKVIVFLETNMKQALSWKKIDPHFREVDEKQDTFSAPPPAARFPGDGEGWTDALSFAESKRRR